MTARVSDVKRSGGERMPVPTPLHWVRPVVSVAIFAGKIRSHHNGHIGLQWAYDNIMHPWRKNSRTRAWRPACFS